VKLYVNFFKNQHCMNLRHRAFQVLASNETNNCKIKTTLILKWLKFDPTLLRPRPNPEHEAVGKTYGKAITSSVTDTAATPEPY